MGKKLIICIPSLRLGGAAKIALNLCQFYAEKDYKVSLLLTGPPETEDEFQDLPDEVNCFRIGKTFSFRPFDICFQITWLCFHFRRIKPSAILAVRHDATAVAAMAWKIAGRPGGFFIREINPITKTLNRKAPMVRLVKYAYANADGIIANSKGVLEALKSKNWVDPARIYVVDNPVLTDQFFQKAAMPVQDPWLNDAQHPLIITIGRLQKMKDQHTLIQAFARVKGQVDCRLLIIGAGEALPALQHLVEELDLKQSIRFAGGLENPYPYLREADLFVLSSKYEGFGNVLVEALALGKKIVSTDCQGGPAYILNYGEFGTLVQVGATEEMAAAIQKDLHLPVNKEKLIKRAMDFSVAVAGKQYTEILGLQQ